MWRGRVSRLNLFASGLTRAVRRGGGARGNGSCMVAFDGDTGLMGPEGELPEVVEGCYRSIESVCRVL